MSDLQNQIAQVLKDFAPTMPKPETVWCADAIITELGLRQETVGLIHRWVTEWKDT